MADLLDLIKGYRYKETLPTTLNVGSIVDLATALPRTTITPSQLLNRILLEGRSDAGVNGYDPNNKQSAALVKSLQNQGFSQLGATFVAVAKEKQAIAAKSGVSFDEAWNGLGTSSAGLTGKDYANRAANMQGAAQDPRNSNLLDLITRASQGKLTPREKLTTNLASGKSDILDKVFGELGPTYPLTDQLGTSIGSGTKVIAPKSNLAALIAQKAVEQSTNSSEAFNILSNRGSPLYEVQARSMIMTSLKQTLGIDANKYTSDKSNLKAFEENPALKTIIDNIATDMLPTLGIKDK